MKKDVAVPAPAVEPMTLRGFIKRLGSLEAAAAAAGVSGSTYWRWVEEIHEPKGNNARRLRELGVAW